MAKPKIENSLYYFLVGAVSSTLPLEFAIRASEAKYPEAMSRLKEIDGEIRACLLEWGAREEELDAEHLIDHAWDCLQVGLSRVRSHGRIRHPKISSILQRCSYEIHSEINLADGDLALPATKYFRVCDLLKGGDIGALLFASGECLRVAKGYEKSDEIDLSKFTALQRLRQPVHLHPSVEFGVDFTDAGERRIFFALKVDSAFSAFDLERQITEFLYQVAFARKSWANFQRDAVSDGLLQKILGKEVAGELSEESVTRIDGIAAVLAGLYCRDLHKKKGLKLSDAKQATLKIYRNSEEAVAKNYKQVNASIKKYIERFELGVIADPPRL